MDRLPDLKKEGHHLPPHSAGRLAITNIPVVGMTENLGEVQARLQQRINEYQSINYIYVVDQAGRLAGVLSIKDLLRNQHSQAVKEVMSAKLVTVHPYTDQERVAHLALKANIKAVPVVDKENLFIGVVPSDTIIDVIYSEGVEDIAHLAGVPEMPLRQSLEQTPVWRLVNHRWPWLLVGLLGSLAAAKIVGLFSGTLTENIILASFIPMIMYMGGSSLSQTQAFFIRDLALVHNLNFKKYFFRQSQVTLLIAFCLSLLMYLAVRFLLGYEFDIARVLAVALFAVLISTVLTSLLIPYLFFKFKKDPADGSGPLATIVQDLLGITLYFIIALLLL